MAIVDIQSMYKYRKDLTAFPITEELAKGFNWEVETVSGGKYTLDAGEVLIFDFIPEPKFLFIKSEEDADGGRRPVAIDPGTGVVIQSAYFFMEVDEAPQAIEVENEHADPITITLYIGGNK